MLLLKPTLLAVITCTIACAVGAPFDGGASVKIIGGVPANPAEFPYLVSIQVRRPNHPRNHGCGGTLIDMTHVVTTATCLQYITDYSLFAVVAGSYYHSEAIQGLEQLRDVNDIIFHPKYDKQNPQYNDVAVIELTKPFEVTTKVRALPFAKANQLTSVCTIVGWGQTEESGSEMSEKLRKANVTVNSISQCESFYPKDFDKNFQLCAGGIKEMAGPCLGDDGGPLLCRDVYSNYVFAGISSWGKGCENDGHPAPAVYMDVVKYRSWLDSVIHG